MSQGYEAIVSALAANQEFMRPPTWLKFRGLVSRVFGFEMRCEG